MPFFPRQLPNICCGVIYLCYLYYHYYQWYFFARDISNSTFEGRSKIYNSVEVTFVEKKNRKMETAALREVNIPWFILYWFSFGFLLTRTNMESTIHFGKRTIIRGKIAYKTFEYDLQEHYSGRFWKRDISNILNEFAPLFRSQRKIQPSLMAVTTFLYITTERAMLDS